MTNTLIDAQLGIFSPEHQQLTSFACQKYAGDIRKQPFFKVGYRLRQLDYPYLPFLKFRGPSQPSSYNTSSYNNLTKAEYWTKIVLIKCCGAA